MRIGFLVSHPIQYYAPVFRELAKRCELTVYFAHRQTAEQQARAGFGVAFDWDVDLLSGYEHRFLTNVARQPSTDTFWGCDTPAIAREIVDGRFDAFVVPGWALKCYWQAILACRRTRVPIFVRGDSQLAEPRRPMVRIAKALAFPSLLRNFDGFLYVGQRNRDYLLHNKVPAERMFFSPHCVDNDWFRTRADAARAASGKQRRSLRRVLFVGKLVGRKNPLDALQAAARVRAAGAMVEMAFAGSGELQDALQNAARATGLPTEFLGFVNQSQMPSVYASADVVVLPSDGSETWGLAINEAMACGVPAVVADAVGCGPDLIEEGATGAVFPVGNVKAMAAAIEKVLAFDPSSCRRHLAARIEQYSPARAADGVLEGANRLCGQRLLK
ncbi:MAG TPA: glycosyltransferase family 4 protein [Reyranella sp.]|nr:glycosyltransferase family 4 protein [Reyranella sp.]